MTIDPLESPKSKIERANEHIVEVQARIKAFLQTPPYPITTFKEVDATGMRESLKVKLTNPIPSGIATVVGDAANNLRSALDHLACCLAIKNGATNVSGTYFPFAGDKLEFELPGTQRKIKRLAPEARDLVIALQPYKGGNDFLWSLSKVASLDKHQSLIAVAALSDSWTGTFSMVAGSTETQVFEAAKMVRLDQDGTLLRYPYIAGRDVEAEIEITVDIAFGEIDPIKNQPALAVLNQFSGLVERIVLLFEDRFFKP